MNNLEYKFLNWLNQKQNHEAFDIHQFSQEQYEHLNELSKKILKEELGLSSLEFEKILTQIYNVLKLRITDREWNVVITHYLYRLSADCVLEFQKIDLNWCLDKLFYLVTWTEKKVTRKYADDLLYIQDQLYEQFEIQETFLEKEKRKARTFSLSFIGH